MDASSPNGAECRVIYPEKVRNDIKTLAQRAKAKGLGTKFVAALKFINDQLRLAPKSFGDPVYRLPALQLTVHNRVYEPLIVAYAVHKHKLLVFVRGLRPFPHNAY
jgi:hypothetical protein